MSTVRGDPGGGGLKEADIVDFAVDYARQKGASYAEARYERQQREEFLLKNGVLDALLANDDAGIGVRVLAKGGLGFAATNSLGKADVKAIVDDAVKMAKSAGRKHPIVFAQEDALVTQWSVPEAKRFADVPIEDRIEQVVHVDRELQATGFKIPARFFDQTCLRIDKYFANSESSRIASYSPRWRDRKSTRLNSSHIQKSRMPSSA